MVRTQIQLTTKQAEMLKRLAREKHQSVAGLIREAVNNMIKTRPILEEGKRRKRAIAAAGRFHSGVSDLSTAHDKYLGGAY